MWNVLLVKKKFPQKAMQSQGQGATCSACTFQNVKSATKCSICANPLPPPLSPPDNRQKDNELSLREFRELWMMEIESSRLQHKALAHATRLSELENKRRLLYPRAEVAKMGLRRELEEKEEKEEKDQDDSDTQNNTNKTTTATDLDDAFHQMWVEDRNQFHYASEDALFEEAEVPVEEKVNQKLLLELPAQNEKRSKQDAIVAQMLQEELDKEAYELRKGLFAIESMEASARTKVQEREDGEYVEEGTCQDFQRFNDFDSDFDLNSDVSQVSDGKEVKVSDTKNAKKEASHHDEKKDNGDDKNEKENEDKGDKGDNGNNGNNERVKQGKVDTGKGIKCTKEQICKVIDTGRGDSGKGMRERKDRKDRKDRNAKSDKERRKAAKRLRRLKRLAGMYNSGQMEKNRA